MTQYNSNLITNHKTSVFYQKSHFIYNRSKIVAVFYEGYDKYRSKPSKTYSKAVFNLLKMLKRPPRKCKAHPPPLSENPVKEYWHLLICSFFRLIANPQWEKGSGAHYDSIQSVFMSAVSF